MHRAFAALLPALLCLSAPAATSTDLDVYRSDLRFAGDRAKLFLETNLDALLADRAETLRVTLGTAVVFDAALLSERAKPRTNVWGEYLVRDPAHLGANCRLRLEYQPGSGYLRMRLTGLDAASIRAAGPTAVPVAIEVSGRTVRAFVTYVVLGPRRWAWRMEGHGHVGPATPPVDPPVVPPPAPGDGFRPYHEIARGGNSAILSPMKTVLRSTGAYYAFWNQHAPGTTPPSVDFQQEMVLAYVGGTGLPSNRVDIGPLEVLGGVLMVPTKLGRNVGYEGNVSPFTVVATPATTIPIQWR